MTTHDLVIDALAALLRGEEVPLRARGLSSADLYDACIAEDVAGLVQEQIGGAPHRCDLSQDVREALRRRTRTAAALESVRQREIVTAIDRLASEGVHPILVKGTPLAYSVYNVPSSRPRSDTDFFIRRDEVDAVRRVMRALGYTEPLLCDGELLFCQFQVQRQDARRVTHVFDVHWKISTQSVFAELLTHDELSACATPVPALGPHARAAGPLHALLIACIHPVMHHRNIERLLWIYDIHLLAGRLSDAEFDQFASLASSKAVAAAAGHGLALARTRLGTRIPDRVIATLDEMGRAEPSADYLKPDRHWKDEFVSSIRGLPRWQDRLRLLREVALPSPRYMLAAYGFGKPATPLLPILYLHRLLNGGWKGLTGRK
jgi:hypothetical protein